MIARCNNNNKKLTILGKNNLAFIAVSEKALFPLSQFETAITQ